MIVITGGTSGIGEATAYKMAEAGAQVVVVARDPEKAAPVMARIKALGGKGRFISCDLADLADCDRLVATVLKEFGRCDYLVNNAGRSIRRGIASSFDRFHDFERTMQLNYFGSLRLIMGFLPAMMKQNKGHVINISSIGVLTQAPRFSAYVASKAALDSFTGCAASEFADNNITFTTINMPLVRTPMIAPTKLYNHVPTLTPEQAADLVVEAIVYKPVRIATRLGIFGALLHAVAPKATQIILNAAFRMFPDSTAAQGRKDGAKEVRAHAGAGRLRADHPGHPLVGAGAWARLAQGRRSGPDFEGVTTRRRPRRRSRTFRGRKLVLYFYPMDDTPGCTKQACSLRDHNAEIAARGAAILGVSTQDEALAPQVQRRSTGSTFPCSPTRAAPWAAPTARSAARASSRPPRRSSGWPTA